MDDDGAYIDERFVELEQTAVSLARTGAFPYWQAVSRHMIHNGYPDAHKLFDVLGYTARINELCREAQRNA